MGSCFYDAVHSKAAELSGLRVILERVNVCEGVCVCMYKHACTHPCLWISDINRGLKLFNLGSLTGQQALRTLLSLASLTLIF